VCTAVLLPQLFTTVITNISSKSLSHLTSLTTNLNFIYTLYTTALWKKRPILFNQFHGEQSRPALEEDPRPPNTRLLPYNDCPRTPLFNQAQLRSSPIRGSVDVRTLCVQSVMHVVRSNALRYVPHHLQAHRGRMNARPYAHAHPTRAHGNTTRTRTGQHTPPPCQQRSGLSTQTPLRFRKHGRARYPRLSATEGRAETAPAGGDVGRAAVCLSGECSCCCAFVPNVVYAAGCHVGVGAGPPIDYAVFPGDKIPNRFAVTDLVA